MQPPQSRSSYPLIENDTYHTDGKPHIICCSVLGKLMSNFHLEMICNRTSCMYDIVKFMVDHWIRIKLLFFFPVQTHVLLLIRSQTKTTLSCKGLHEESPATFKKKCGREIWKGLRGNIKRQSELRPNPQATWRTLSFKSDNVTDFTSY